MVADAHVYVPIALAWHDESVHIIEANLIRQRTHASDSAASLPTDTRPLPDITALRRTAALAIPLPDRRAPAPEAEPGQGPVVLTISRCRFTHQIGISPGPARIPRPSRAPRTSHQPACRQQADL